MCSGAGELQPQLAQPLGGGRSTHLAHPIAEGTSIPCRRRRASGLATWLADARVADTQCYCQPCHPAPRHSCVPRQGLRPVHGLRPPTEPGTTLLHADMQLVARRARIVEHAWVRVAHEALGADGQVIPQQWLAHTTAPNVGAEDRRRLDLVVYGATPHGGALCCDATLVSPLTRTGHPQPCTVTIDGAALRVAERRKHAAYPELARAGPQKLSSLGTQLRPPAGASESPASPASHPRSGRGGLDTAMVEHAVRGGPTSGRQHSIGRALAAAPAAGRLQGPAAGCSAAGDRPSWLPLRP